MIKTIHFKQSEYPHFQSVGFASKFAFPFAMEVCKGVGLDIGCGKLEWCLPGAIALDPVLWEDEMKDHEEHQVWLDVIYCDAMHLPVLIDYPLELMKTMDLIDLSARHRVFDEYQVIENLYDYIFSSHCLEHVNDWVGTLEYWTKAIKSGGVLFLYLPDFSQEYWRPWNNRKHLHSFTPELLTAWFESNGYIKVFCSGIDLNNSFMIMGEKA